MQSIGFDLFVGVEKAHVLRAVTVGNVFFRVDGLEGTL